MSYISSEYIGEGTANTGTFGITVPGTCKLAVALVTGYASTGYYSGRTSFRIGSTEMACPSSAADTDASWMGCLFYLIDPPTGAQTVTYDWAGSAAGAENHRGLFAYYTDVVTGERAAQGMQSGSASTFATSSIAAQSGDLIIAGAWAVDGATGDTTVFTGNNVTKDVEIWGFLADTAMLSATASGAQTASVTYGITTEGGIIGVALTTGGTQSNAPRAMFALTGVG
jgi:hypothetical protein